MQLVCYLFNKNFEPDLVYERQAYKNEHIVAKKKFIGLFNTYLTQFMGIFIPKAILKISVIIVSNCA